MHEEKAVPKEVGSGVVGVVVGSRENSPVYPIFPYCVVSASLARGKACKISKYISPRLMLVPELARGRLWMLLCAASQPRDAAFISRRSAV